MSVQFENNTREFLRLFEQKQIEALEQIAVAGDSWVMPLIPVDTGNLRGNQSFEINEGEKEVVFYNNTEYAPYQELGTSKMSAQPFLRPGIEGNIKKIQQIVARVMKF